MNKIVKAGVTLAGNIVLGQAIVFMSLVTMGLAAEAVTEIKVRLKKNRDSKKEGA